MKILITGGSGMVGRNILAHENVADFEFLNPTSAVLNLLSFSEVDEYIKNNTPDLIIHAAGKVGGIHANMADPVGFLVDNLDMGRNVILAAKKNRVAKLLNLGSSCMYPRDAANPLNEDLILKGELEPTNEGYALAKVVAARLCAYISQEDNYFAYKTIIPCNLFGAYDKFSPKNSHMLPAVIRKIHEAKENQLGTIDIWGDGLARREFMHAEDLANFIFFAIDNFEKMPQNLNVGLGYDYTINEYYKAIADVIGYTGDFVHDLSKPVGMKQKLIDVTRLSEFGWKHALSMKEGIEKTYDFYKNNILKDEL
ncbi:GDP-L-fucose synthase family protein [Flavicella sediminum]|uniref:GDP-L-fucose synthase family protein n=1 Tax=Flavicella sediminum TaxID=2585141 RepID=UPI00111D4CE8|nr:GDP-L-fucose synthase [Flavicella sediminum]